MLPSDSNKWILVTLLPQWNSAIYNGTETTVSHCLGIPDLLSIEKSLQWAELLAAYEMEDLETQAVLTKL